MNSKAQINLVFLRIGIAILIVLFALLIISRVIYPFGIGSWEAFNWTPATHLLEGQNPYSFALRPPYSMAPYGIVYYALIAIGVKIFGFQIWFGRVLSVVAFTVCVFSAAQITKKITEQKESFLLTILAGLAMFPAQIWIAIMRADLIAAAFGLSALWVVFSIDKSKKTRISQILLVILFALAAIFTKQTYLLVSAIIFLRFLQMEKWREAFCFAFFLSALTAFVMFVLNYSSNGGYFWQHFVHAARLPFERLDSFRLFFEMLKQPTFFFGIIFVSIFARYKFIDYQQFNREKLIEILRSPKFLLSFYFAISAAFAFMSSGRQGGNVNYYIENSFALAIFCGFVYHHFNRDLVRKFALAMIFLSTLGGAFQLIRVLNGEFIRWQSVGYYREIFQTAGQLTPPSGTCISIYPELVVWNGCKFNFDDFEEYDGTWSPELHEIFEREIKQGRYDIIIWYDNSFQTKFPNYRLVPMSQKPPERFYPVYLYVRQSDQSE